MIQSGTLQADGCKTFFQKLCSSTSKRRKFEKSEDTKISRGWIEWCKEWLCQWSSVILKTFL